MTTPAIHGAPFGGDVEPGEPGWAPLLDIEREAALDRVLFARNEPARRVLALEAEALRFGGYVEPDEPGFEVLFQAASDPVSPLLVEAEAYGLALEDPEGGEAV